MSQGKLVERVEAGSIAEELGIAGGDYVIAINGAEPADILDWQLAESDEELILTIQHQDGELVEYEIEKDYDETLGIILLPHVGPAAYLSKPLPFLLCGSDAAAAANSIHQR